MSEILKEIEELEDKYFMLQMVDRWTDGDFRYAQELRQKIKEKKEELNKGKETN